MKKNCKEEWLSNESIIIIYKKKTKIILGDLLDKKKNMQQMCTYRVNKFKQGYKMAMVIRTEKSHRGLVSKVINFTICLTMGPTFEK